MKSTCKIANYKFSRPGAYFQMNNNNIVTTPKKVYFKEKHRGYCRLCGCYNESRYMINVLSIAAVQKFLVEIISESSGIVIARSDSLPKTVCRKCIAFVKKIHLYKGQCQQAQTDLRKQVTVKRCPVESPKNSKARPPKRQAMSRPETGTLETGAPNIIPLVQGDTQIRSTTIPTRSAKTRLDLSSTSNSVVPSTEPLSVESTNTVASECALPVTTVTCNLSSTSITARQIEKITAAAQTKDASVFADIVMKHCPHVVKEIKRKVTDNIKASCKNLCHRNDGSVLHAGRQKQYEMMINFSFIKLWEEMENKIPYFIEVLNAVTGVGADEAKEKFQAKYGFLYAVLMNVRWQELSLVQRLNTLCLIEGGCSKQVQFFFVFLTAKTF